MLKNFSTFDQPSLPIDAVKYLPNPLVYVPQTNNEKNTMTDSLVSIFPKLETATCSKGVRICPQSEWLLGRLSKAFNEFFSNPLNRSGLHGPPPVDKLVSDLTGLHYWTVNSHSIRVPKCPSNRKKKVARRDLWEQAANSCPIFIRDKIRQVVHRHYREQRPVKVKELITEVQQELGQDDIIFSPNTQKMQYILKGMGMRHERIKKQNVESNFVQIHNLQLDRRVQRFVIPLTDESESEGESEDEKEVTDNENSEVEEIVEDKENMDPDEVQMPSPNLLSPCPKKSVPIPLLLVQSIVIIFFNLFLLFY